METAGSATRCAAGPSQWADKARVAERPRFPLAGRSADRAAVEGAAMHAHRSAPSSADVAAKASTVLAGLRVLKMALFPLALPGAVDLRHCTMRSPPSSATNLSAGAGGIAAEIGEMAFRRRGAQCVGDHDPADSDGFPPGGWSAERLKTRSWCWRPFDELVRSQRINRNARRALPGAPRSPRHWRHAQFAEATAPASEPAALRRIRAVYRGVGRRSLIARCSTPERRRR
jgi:hypothetical protein